MGVSGEISRAAQRVTARVGRALSGVRQLGVVAIMGVLVSAAASASVSCTLFVSHSNGTNVYPYFGANSCDPYFDGVGNGGFYSTSTGGTGAISPAFSATTDEANFTSETLTFQANLDTQFQANGRVTYTYYLTPDYGNTFEPAQVTFVIGAPIVNSVSPAGGPTAGGTSVTLSGSNFNGTSQVQFGGNNASSFTVNSANQITAISPAGTAGLVNISVINPGGASTAGSAQFSYIAPPTVNSVAPSSGPAAGGTAVTLTGTGFTGATSVRFGGVAATGLTVLNDSTITVNAPSGSAGTVDVTVTTPGGTSSFRSADQFTYLAAPSISGISPTAGPLAGGTSVILTGSGFTGATGVRFGATAASFTFSNDHQITATSPANGAGVYDITVTTPAGTSSTTSADQFSYVNPPIAGPVSVTVSYGSTSNPVTLNISGGTPTSVAIATAASHGTATANGTSISYTPAVGYAGPDSFTYTASNAGGTSAPQTITVTVTPGVLALSPLSLPGGTVGVVYSQTITGTGGTAPYTYSITSGPLPAGLTLNPNTGVVSGTPTASGSYNLSLTVTDHTSATASNGFTMTIALAVVTVNPATLPGGLVGVAYSQTVSASGGTAPYGYSVVSGTLPTGLSLNATTGAISGTPTAAGTFAFTIQARDASTGVGAPFSGTHNYTVTMGQAIPVAGAVNSTVAFNSSNNLVPLTLTGGAAVSVAVPTAPAHGTVAINGTAVSYTPTAGYYGTDSFTYTATNTSGTSAPATVSITVNPMLPAPQAQATTVVSNSAANAITLAIQGGPVTSLTIVTLPQHGSLTINGASSGAAVAVRQAVAAGNPTVTYTPNHGYSGPDSFSYTASNAAGTSAAATVTLQVTLPAPVLGPVTGTAVSGQTLTLDVGAAATGGPFTGLIITAQPANGTATVQGNTIVYASTTTFVGSAAIGYALSNAYGTSQGTATVTVNARLDPSHDAEVIGLLAAQADATRRFATAQLDNFNHRLESLHTDGWGKSSFDLAVSSFGVQGESRANGAAATPPADCARTPGKDRSPTNADDINLCKPAKTTSAPAERQDLTFWVGGNINLGERDGNSYQEHFHFHTDGISLGSDYHVNDQLTLGVGGGYSRDTSDVGDNGSKSTGSTTVAVGYGSYRPMDLLFIDGVIGYGAINFDLDRYITDTGGFATGSRNGSQFFGSLVSGYQLRNPHWLITPYGRLDLMSAKLDGYTENAAGVSALNYADQTIKMTTGKLGLRGEGNYDVGSARWLPRGQLEFQHHFEGGDQANMSYADLGALGPVYSVYPQQAQRNQWQLDLGTKLQLRNDMAFTLDYSCTLDNQTGRSESFHVGMEARF